VAILKVYCGAKSCAMFKVIPSCLEPSKVDRGDEAISSGGVALSLSFRECCCGLEGFLYLGIVVV